MSGSILSISFLFVSGYQRELSYQHSDGSYSAFGEKYGGSSGSLWCVSIKQFK